MSKATYKSGMAVSIILVIVVAVIAVACIGVAVVVNKTSNVMYSVEFDSNGGSNVAKATVKKGEKVEKPINPTKEGYDFVQWELGNVPYNFNTPVEKDIVLVAKWNKDATGNIQKVTVSFDTNGGNEIKPQAVEKGKTVVKPQDPIKTGFKFKEWTENGKAYSFEQIVEKDITLVATWEEEDKNVTKYTVTFNSNGGSTVKSQSIAEGSKVSKPTNPTRQGYNFSGWTLNGVAYDFSQGVTKNITLVANWNELAKPKYTVTFDSNGGSAVTSQEVKKGEKITRPSNPTKVGYKFISWKLNGADYNFNSGVTQNITLVANWQAKVYTVNVKKVDDYSPDRILEVFEDGTKINVTSIKYTDGTLLCSGSNTAVNVNDLTGESVLTIVLVDGTQVNASIK